MMDAKGSPPEAGNPEAEPRSVVNFAVVVAAITFVLALLLVCTSILVRWEVAFARPAISKVLDLADVCVCTATAVA